MVIEWDLKSNFRMVLFVLAECHLVSFAKSSVFILGERECVSLYFHVLLVPTCGFSKVMGAAWHQAPGNKHRMMLVSCVFATLRSMISRVKLENFSQD